MSECNTLFTTCTFVSLSDFTSTQCSSWQVLRRTHFHASLNTVSPLQCSRIIRFSEHDVLRPSGHGMPRLSKHSSHASARTDYMLQWTHITRSSEHSFHASVNIHCTLHRSQIARFDEHGMLRFTGHGMSRFSKYPLHAS